jgi:hypothetical protein
LQWTFNKGSAIALNGNLLLDNVSIDRRAGRADFAGGAALINLPGRRLFLSDGVLSADFNVLLINQGLLHLGALGADGQVQGKDFEQSGTGMLHIVDRRSPLRQHVPCTPTVEAGRSFAAVPKEIAFARSSSVTF